VPYPIILSDGVTTLISIPDRVVLGPLETNAPSNCSLNLVGRGSVNFGLPIATNFVWLLQNFANTTAPVSPLPGQLWYNNTAGASALKLYNTDNQWVTIATSDSELNVTGDLTVGDADGDQSILGANGTITLIRSDYTPRITFEGQQNSANAVVLQYGIDEFGIPDLTLYSPGFLTGTKGFIWHSQNLTPFNIQGNNTLSGNNIFAGNNTFTGTNTFVQPADFSEIIVNNVSNTANTDILPGVITLKNDTTGNNPVLIFLSSNPSSTTEANIHYTDPDLIMNFLSTPSTVTGGLRFNPTSNVTDSNTLHTVYHTGNLAPLVQSATSQTITGSINLYGTTSNLNIGGTTTSTGIINGNGGGAFTGNLTLNGSAVLTSASLGSVGYLPLTGGTLTNTLTLSSGSIAVRNGGVISESYYIQANTDRNLLFQDTSGNQYGYIQSRYSDGAIVFSVNTGGGNGSAILNTIGDLTVSANIIAGLNVIAYSDAKFKDNVETIDNALSLIQQMRGVRYTDNRNGKTNIGVIAQEVQKVVPEIVHENEEGILSVAYGNALALSINAIKELSSQITALRMRIEQLENK
jgi:hypothetical protein